MMINAHLVENLKAIVGVVEEIGESIGSEPNLFEDKLTHYIT